MTRMPIVTSQTAPVQAAPESDKRPDTSVVEGLETKSDQATAPEGESLSPKFAALARQEQKLRRQMREIQEREKSYAGRDSELAALKAEAEQAKAFKSKLVSDPWSALIEAGLSPEQATTAILNQPKAEDAELRTLKQELQALKDEQTNFKKQGQDQQSQAYDQAKKQIASEVTMLVDGNEEFETIKAMGAVDAVVELIEQEFHKTGQLIPADQAAREVEAYLEEQAMGFARLKKIQSKLNPTPAPQAETKPQTSQKTQSTLSNRMTQTSTSKLTERERIERAKAAFNGTLS